MHAPTTPHTLENWDSASQGYAEKVAPTLMEAFAAETVETLDVGSGMEALEVGAGSGALTETLAGRVGSLLAIDFAPRMIEVLRARMQSIGATNVTCEVMDGQALAVEDAQFDRAASSFAIMLFPDRAKGFSEMCRVLRPGGRAVVTGWTGPERFEAFGIFLHAMKVAFPEMPPPPAPPPVFSLADPKAFQDEMEAGGFRDVEIGFLSRDVEVPNFEHMWAMFTAGAPPVKVLFDRIGPDGVTRLRDTLAEIVEQRFGGGPIRLTNVATIGSGVAS